MGEEKNMGKSGFKLHLCHFLAIWPVDQISKRTEVGDWCIRGTKISVG
jgi:hypothetical protein